MAFVRVTDPELAAELYSNGLLYEQEDDGAVIPAWGWNGDTAWCIRLEYHDCKFYVQLEE